MTVSVIIPAYCAEHTICDAVDSALGQDIGDMEIIVVDDCSTDNTVAVMREHYGANPRLRTVVTERNLGPAGARNTGVALAKGNWIAFLDGDDVWCPWRLRTQLALAEDHTEIDCWCGRAVRWGEPGASDELPARPHDPTFRKIVPNDLLKNNEVATSSVLVKRQILAAVGGFDPSFRGPEDFDLWLRLAAVGRVVFIDAPLARYRYQPGSLSLDDRTFLPEVLRVLDKAFGPTGVLENRQESRALAVSTQYWNASWMAFVRGDRRSAIGHWWQAWRMNGVGPERVARPWWRILARYTLEHAGAQPPRGGATKKGTGIETSESRSRCV